MQMFEVRNKGKDKDSGLCRNQSKKNFLALFQVGSKVYIRKNARNGELKSVVIKRFAKSLADSLDGDSNP
jgi:hypothetical protein